MGKRLQDALKIRNMARELAIRAGWCEGARLVVKRRGWESFVNGSPLCILLRERDQGRFQLPCGLDIWAPYKVLNIEWDPKDGAVSLRSFRRGDWERNLHAAWLRVAAFGQPPGLIAPPPNPLIFLSYTTTLTLSPWVLRVRHAAQDPSHRRLHRRHT